MLAVKDREGRSIGESVQFVTFDLSDTGASQQMAINVQKIKEVIEFSGLSELPGSSIPVLGVVNLRGTPIPVLDISKILGALTWNLLNPSRILICELQKVWVGIPVSKTGRILTCDPTNFLPPPKVVDLGEKRYYSGLVRIDKNFTPVLDIDNILVSIGFEFHEKHIEKIERLYEGRRILVVEDSKMIQRKIGNLFEKLGIIVTFASDGLEGFQKLSNASAPFDIIFTDIEMPLCDGIAMARQIRQKPEFSHLPILFNSALSNPALIRDIENESLGRYIVKFDEELMLHELAVILR